MQQLHALGLASYTPQNKYDFEESEAKSTVKLASKLLVLDFNFDLLNGLYSILK